MTSHLLRQSKRKNSTIQEVINSVLNILLYLALLHVHSLVGQISSIILKNLPNDTAFLRNIHTHLLPWLPATIHRHSSVWCSWCNIFSTHGQKECCNKITNTQFYRRQLTKLASVGRLLNGSMVLLAYFILLRLWMLYPS